MTGDVGKQYLRDYLKKTDPLFEEYLQGKIEEAQKISKIPAELLKRFLATARLEGLSLDTTYYYQIIVTAPEVFESEVYQFVL